MPVAPSIFGNIRIPQPIPDPIQQYGQAMQLKGLLRNEADDKATRQAYQESGGDPDKLRTLLYGSGQYKQAVAAEKAGLETQKTKSDIQKNDIDLIKKFGDEADAQWRTLNKDNWKEFRDVQIARAGTLSMPENRKIAIREVLRMPEVFDQSYIDARIKAKQKSSMEGKRPFVITDAAGGTKLVDVEGRVIKDLGGVGRPTATHEKTVAARRKLTSDLDQSIKELEKATADGGLIDKSTGSGIGAGVDWTAGLFGRATEGSIAVGAMKPVADLVLKLVPRFEGPQSDKDTASYREAAGDLANPNMPNERKKMAGREILRLMKARRNQFISKDMEGTEADASQPAIPTPSAPTVPGIKEIDAELRRRKAIK